MPDAFANGHVLQIGPRTRLTRDAEDGIDATHFVK